LSSLELGFSIDDAGYSAERMTQSSSDTRITKAAAASLTEMTEYVLPQHANALGTVFGGQIMAWVDLCAAICSQRHSGKTTVTAFVDDVKFQEPVKVGEVVRLRARLTATFRTSMEIEVVVQGEDPRTQRIWPCVDALLVFVAIDQSGAPVVVPLLDISTPEAAASQAAGEARRTARLAKR
jgi:acyl-CoA hydrolase